MTVLDQDVGMDTFWSHFGKMLPKMCPRSVQMVSKPKIGPNHFLKVSNSAACVQKAAKPQESLDMF